MASGTAEADARGFTSPYFRPRVITTSRKGGGASGGEGHWRGPRGSYELRGIGPGRGVGGFEDELSGMSGESE